MDQLKPKDVAAYIANADMSAHAIMNTLRKLIKDTIPEVEEKISYSVPFYKYHGEFVGFAVYKKHVSFGFGSDILEESDRKSLKENGYVIGKGTIQIKFQQAVPTAMIKKILIKKATLNELQHKHI